MIRSLCLFSLVALCGCVEVTATKDSIKVSSFLTSIKQGVYTNAAGGIALTVNDASPDQQSIATLAGAVADLGKTAMLMSKSPVTNSVAVSTNSTGTVVVTPATPK